VRATGTVAREENERSPAQSSQTNVLRGAYAWFYGGTPKRSTANTPGSARSATSAPSKASEAAKLCSTTLSLPLELTHMMDDEPELFRLALEAAPAGMLMTDASGTIVLVNKELERLFGYARSELVGRPLEILIPERFRSGIAALRAGYVHRPTARRMGEMRELFGLRKDGSEIPIEIGLNPVQTKNGSFVLSSVSDITGRKRSEREREALMTELALEERFKTIFEHSPIAMAILDERLMYAHVNSAYTSLLGYSPSELAGKTPAAITHPEDRAQDEKLIESLSRSESQAYTREKRYLRRDGTIVYVLLHAAIVRDPAGRTYYIGQVQDITPRIRAEREVQALQAELSREAEIKGMILKNMPRGALFLLDRDLRYLSAYGPSVWDLLHFAADQLPGRSAAQLIPERHKEEVLAHIRATLDGKEVVFEAVRGEHTYEVRTAPIYSGEPEPVAALIHLYDITERKAQERALAEERERVRMLVTNAPVGIFEMDVHGNVRYMNDRWTELTGLSREDAGSPAARLAGIHPDDRESVLSAWSKARAESTGYKVDFRYQGPNGKPKRLSSVAAPMRGPDGSVTSFIGITVDATAQLEAADAIQRSLREKETLLKEIHHRVKNNLQVIGSIIGLQANRTKEPGVRSILDDLRSRIQAIALLHERLYGSPDLGAIDLGAYIRELVTDSARAAGSAADRIRVHSEGGPITLGVDDAVPVGLVVNELVTNAVKHGVRGTEHAKVEIEIAVERDAVRVTVADEGPGFSDSFKPDFERTLGMLLIRNLTRQLRGEISFSSRPTRVTLRFPLTGARGANDASCSR
jgi:PAS domain S-box-containing protein